MDRPAVGLPLTGHLIYAFPTLISLLFHYDPEPFMIVNSFG